MNFPRLLAQVRGETYRKYAWPGFLARAFDANGLVTSLATAASLAFMLLFAALLTSPARLFAAWSDAQGSFYAVIPHDAMVAVFGAVSAFVLVALVVGFARFWADTGEEAHRARGRGSRRPARSATRSPSSTWTAAGTAAPTRTKSPRSRAGASTTSPSTGSCCASRPPRGDGLPLRASAGRRRTRSGACPCSSGRSAASGSWSDRPGSLWLKRRRDPKLADPTQKGMEAGFLALLFLTSLTGLALLALPRDARHGHAARRTPRRRAGAVRDHALRQVRARPLPLRRTRALPPRAPAARRP